MSLVPHKIVALEGDTATAISTGKTTIASAVVVLYDSDNNAITLYDDAAFLNPAASKTTDSNGELVVFLTPGEYTQSVNGSTALPVTVGSASPVTVDTFANLLLLSPEQTGQAFICQERASAPYILKDETYAALAGDVTFSNSRVAQLQLGFIVNAENFGKFNNTNDNTILASIATRVGSGAYVKFYNNFAITQTVNFTSGCTLDFTGITIDATGCPSSTSDRTLNEAIVFSGTIESAESITANLLVGAGTFETSSPTMAAGDTVFIQSSQLFVDGWSGSVNNKRGEIVTIKSVSGTTVAFNEPLYFSYLTASSLTATKINTISPKVIGGTMSRGGVGSEGRGLYFKYCRDFKVDGTIIDGAEDACYSTQFCHTGQLDIEARNATTPTSGFNTGYGITLEAASRNIRVNMTGINCKHVVTGGGAYPVLDMNIKGIAYDSGITATAWDCHEPCFNWTWDVQCVGGTAGIGIRGNDQFVRIKTRDTSSNAVRIVAFDDSGLQSNIHIDADVERCGSSAVTLTCAAQPLDNVSIKLQSKDATLNAIGAVGNTTNRITNLKLDLSIDTTSTEGVVLLYCDDVDVTCSSIKGTGGVSFRNENSTNLNFNVSKAICDTANVFNFSNCDEVQINGQYLASLSGSPLFTNSCTNVKLTANKLIATGSTADCWRAVDTIGGKLTASTLVSGRHGVFSSGTSDKFITALNDVTGVTNADKFNLSGSNNVEVDNLS